MQYKDETVRARQKLLWGVFIIFLLLSLFFLWLFFRNGDSNPTGFKSPDSSAFYEEPQLIDENMPLSFANSFDWQHTVYGKIPGLRNITYPRSGILIDLTDKKVLWALNPHKKVSIASMTKMMTILIAFEAIRNNNSISLESPVKASARCASIRVGAMGLTPNRLYILRELMMAAVIRSANDAASQIAEFIGGNSIENFVKLMNAKALELEMDDSCFFNPNGLPERKTDNYSSAFDIALLSAEILKYPQYLSWSTILQTFICDGKKELTNTNNLLRKRKCPGVDGLKTGYTNRAGFCLAFSCIRNQHRYIGVITGFPQSRQREDFAESLLNWAAPNP